MTTTQAARADERWQAYLDWNRALADVIYSPLTACTPAYLDPEPEVLQAASVAAGVDISDLREALIEAVRATLNPPSRSGRPLAGGHVGPVLAHVDERSLAFFGVDLTGPAPRRADVDWSLGDGAKAVEEPAVDLLLALTGRRAL